MAGYFLLTYCSLPLSLAAAESLPQAEDMELHEDLAPAILPSMTGIYFIWFIFEEFGHFF